MMMWRRIQADGCEWEVRAVAHDVGSGGEAKEEVLEFRCPDGSRPPRRVAVEQGRLAVMDDAALRVTFRRALPIGGDHYGRPGKRMADIQV